MALLGFVALFFGIPFLIIAGVGTAFLLVVWFAKKLGIE